MNKKNIFFILILVSCLLVSFLLHEVGHGISAYVNGYPVSTGFNRVGNAYTKPGDINFRTGGENYKVLFDLGPIITLTLALFFTAIFYFIDSKYKRLTFVFGNLALCNSTIRFIPMVNSYLGLILGKGLILEDEIGIGLILNEMYNSEVFIYVISMSSLLISYVCLYITTRLFKKKLPDIYVSRSHFITACVISWVVAFNVANYLDRFLRINWVR